MKISNPAGPLLLLLPSLILVPNPIVTDNNMAESSLSTHSTNVTHNVNQSSMYMTKMTKMMERGNIAMGFNQNKIAHHFAVTSNGGNITITSLNSNDTQTINQIKTHIMDIQKDFSEGNFTKPFFIHAQEVPGTDVMTKKKDLIKYNILELRNGSSLVLITNDKELLDAISQFIKYQATAHVGH
ncbi:MAG: hypothetical protein WAL24_05195 [Nitrososphaeraceae archaeon]